MDEKKIPWVGQLKAQSFSIQVSSREHCNAGCACCISRLTFNANGTNKKETGIVLCQERDLRKGLFYAQRLGATHAILTGKADPLQEDMNYLRQLISWGREYLPFVDIHTNGLELLSKGKHEGKLASLVEAGLTMITFSVSSFDDKTNYGFMKRHQQPEELIKLARQEGLLTRCSLLITKSGVHDFESIMDYIKKAGELGVHFVVIREIWTPEVSGDYQQRVREWSLANKISIGQLEDQFKEVASTKNEYGLLQRDPLPWGTPVFVVSGKFTDVNHGVNVTFARCDEAASGTIIKSIVHKPNGRGYRGWDCPGDYLY